MNINKYKILVVEDENLARIYLKAILAKLIENVYVASNGQEGFEMFLKIKPDLIITDLEMPVMDGVEMIKKIRDAGSDIPIIVTTAYNDDEHNINNIQGKVLKPIVIEEITDLIKKLLINRFI